MGKFNQNFKRMYWLSRAICALPPNPPKEKKFEQCTNEERASRYLHRAYELLSGDTFDRQAFEDMMNPYIGQNNGK